MRYPLKQNTPRWRRTDNPLAENRHKLAETTQASGGFCHRQTTSFLVHWEQFNTDYANSGPYSLGTKVSSRMYFTWRHAGTSLPTAGFFCWDRTLVSQTTQRPGLDREEREHILTSSTQDARVHHTQMPPSSVLADGRASSRTAPTAEGRDPPLSGAVRRDRFLRKVRDIQRKRRSRGEGTLQVIGDPLAEHSSQSPATAVTEEVDIRMDQGEIEHPRTTERGTAHDTGRIAVPLRHRGDLAP